MPQLTAVLAAGRRILISVGGGRSSERLPLFLLLCAALLYYGLLAPALLRLRDRQAVARLHTVADAVLQYAQDNPDGAYPASFEHLRASGYLAELPRNPFSGLPMRARPAGRLPEPGDFIYRPLMRPGERQASGYVLLLGSRRPGFYSEAQDRQPDLP